MNVWINNPFDNLPGEGRRPQRYCLLCRALAKAGHRVVWWSSDFSHPLKRHRTLEPVYDLPEGFQVRLIPTMPYYDNIGLRRAWSHRRYAAAWKRLAEAAVAAGELPKPDLILTSWPPIDTAAIARQLRTKWGCKVVVDVMDAWPRSFHRVISGPKWLKDLLGPLVFARAHASARCAFRQADAVVALGFSHLAFADSYGGKAPRHVSYPGILRMNNGANRYSLDESEPLRLVYIGNMGRSYDLSTVICAIRRLVDEGERVYFDLAGSGPHEDRLRREAKGCSHIRFHGYLGTEDTQQLLADADMAIIPMFPDSCVSIPYKLVDYAAAGLPILCCLTGETQRMIERYRAGTMYRAGDVEDLMATLRAYLHQRSRITQESLASARIARENFMMDDIYPEFVHFLTNL